MGILSSKLAPERNQSLPRTAPLDCCGVVMVTHSLLEEVLALTYLSFTASASASMHTWGASLVLYSSKRPTTSSCNDIW